MQRSLLNQVKPSLFILGLLFSLTTFYCLVTFTDTMGMGQLLIISLELASALGIKWLIATVIFQRMLGSHPQSYDYVASFRKNYGMIAITYIVFSTLLGLLLGAFPPFLIGILVLFQLIAPFLAARAIPGMVSRYDKKPMPTES